MRTPTILQMEGVECGAACIAIILGHHGRWVPLEELRVACGVTRDGSNAKAMLEAARRYGLEARGYRYRPETLERQTAPFVVYWKRAHFMVVDGFDGDVVHVNDPATGPRRLERAEFAKGYVGLMLELRPGPEFRRGGHPPRLWQIVSTRLGQLRRGPGTFALLSLLLIAPGVLVPSFSRIFVDEVMLREQTGMLEVLLAAMAATIAVQAATTWMLQWVLLRIEHKLSLHGSAQLLWHLLRLPYAYFSQRLPGDLANRLRANDLVATAVGQDLGRTLAQLVAATFYVLVMLAFDVPLAGVAIGLTATSALASFAARRRLRDISARVEVKENEVFSDTVAALQTIESIKATGSESMAFTRWAGHHAASINAEQELGMQTTRIRAIPFLTGALTTAAVLGLGSMRIVAGELTIGTVVAIQALATAFKGPMEELAGFLTRLEQAHAALRRVDDVLDYEADRRLDGGAGGEALPVGKVKLDGRVELRNVSFGYNVNEPPLISGLDLQAEPGARIALVGSTASGKSTIAKLIAGLHRPWTGEVRLDGVPADDWPLQLRRNSIGWVDQEVILFEGTVADNLTLWDESTPEAVVTQAAQDASIHDVIAGRPGGYGAPVLENGANFSGGEAQRLELARALAAEPSILILDEATSALDPSVEVRIDGNVRQRGCTTLIVAHRLSTIRDCDEILVLENGRVVERGTHETLMAGRGRYREIVEY
ncbi:MAG: NHLP family bacteriocin export ABC transporter peptidase/permease/ATPase subunit [Rhodospirillaceae bacterium]|nr:NHLP family bacteriocin export ABC transporter peptidase/permease/ATPase subunit [Rhodospirillaceae bacterium]